MTKSASDRRRYRKVQVRIWGDAKFRALSPHAQLAFFFILTHPHMTGLGMMRASLDGMVAEISGKGSATLRETFRKGFEEVFETGIVEYDNDALLIALPKFVSHNPPENPNVLKGLLKSLDLMPECSLLDRQMASIYRQLATRGESFKKLFETLPDTYRKGLATLSGHSSKPCRNQEPEPEQEKKKDIHTPLPPSQAPGVPSSGKGDPDGVCVRASDLGGEEFRSRVGGTQAPGGESVALTDGDLDVESAFTVDYPAWGSRGPIIATQALYASAAHEVGLSTLRRRMSGYQAQKRAAGEKSHILKNWLADGMHREDWNAQPAHDPTERKTGASSATAILEDLERRRGAKAS